MTTDLHDRTWAAVRGAVETMPTIVLEETAGGLMELAEVEGPEDKPESEAGKLWHDLAILILMEVRRRRDVAAN